MRSSWFLILALALAHTFSGEPTASTPHVKDFLQVQTERAVVGAVADVSITYKNNEAITVIYILDFSTDAFPKEPSLLQVRLCGDQSSKLGPAIHTNITLVYNLASQRKLTGCLDLISNRPWRDSSKWQTINFSPLE